MIPFVIYKHKTELPWDSVSGVPQPAGRLSMIDMGHSTRTFNNSACCPRSALTPYKRQEWTIGSGTGPTIDLALQRTISSGQP